MTAVVQAVTVPAALAPNQIGGHGRHCQRLVVAVPGNDCVCLA
eukprot:gene13715-27372_t